MLHQSKKKHVILASAVAISTLFSVTAAASMLYISPHVSQPTVPEAGYAKLNTKGYSQWVAPLKTLTMVGYGMASAHSSHGKAVPIKDAIHLIIPNDGWRVLAHTGVSGSALVSWKAHHQPWTETLQYVLRQAGLVGTVNWPNKAIMLKAQPHVALAPMPKMDVKNYTTWHRSDDSGLPSNFHVGTAVPVSIPSLSDATRVFIMNKGSMILTDLKQWGKMSGWEVVWNLPEDWQVPNTTTFNGDFVQATSQVVQALSKNANIHAKFHTGNNTVVISGTGSGSE